MSIGTVGVYDGITFKHQYKSTAMCYECPREFPGQFCRVLTDVFPILLFSASQLQPTGLQNRFGPDRGMGFNSRNGFIYSSSCAYTYHISTTRPTGRLPIQRVPVMRVVGCETERSKRSAGWSLYLVQIMRGSIESHTSNLSPADETKKGPFFYRSSSSYPRCPSHVWIRFNTQH